MTDIFENAVHSIQMGIEDLMAAETHVKTYRVAVPGDEPAILNIFAEIAPEVPTAVRPQTEGIIKELVATGDSSFAIDADDKIVGYALAAMDTNTLSLEHLPVDLNRKDSQSIMDERVYRH